MTEVAFFCRVSAETVLLFLERGYPLDFGKRASGLAWDAGPQLGCLRLPRSVGTRMLAREECGWPHSWHPDRFSSLDSTAFEFIVREAEATAPPARMVVLRV